MKLSTQNKIIIIIFGILLITIFIYYLNQKLAEKRRRLEGFDIFSKDDWNNEVVKPAVEGVERAANEVINQIVSGVTKFMEPIIGFFNGLQARFDNINNGMNDILNGIIAEANAIGFMFETGGQGVGKIITDVKYVFPFIKAGFEMESANIGEAIKKGDDDLKSFFDALPEIFDPYLVDSSHHDGLFDRLYRISMMYVNCGVKRVVNFAPCFFYYMLNFIGVTLYTIFIAFPLFLMNSALAVDLSSYVDNAFSGLDLIDEFFLELTGYHLIHYSDYIQNKCYYCDGIPHKGIHDITLELDPAQPVFSAPPIPKDLIDATDQLAHDYNPDDGEIPLRLKNMGKFIGNDTANITPSWIISEGIDPSINADYSSASAGLNVFNNDANQLITDFNVNIPNKFKNAADGFFKGGDELRAAFS